MSSTTEATTGTIGGTSDDTATPRGPNIQRKLINTSLVSLKCLLFFFFGGLGCLLPFLPLHMLAVGLSSREIRTISIISPCVAIIGPLIAGPLADKVAAAKRTVTNDKPNKGPSNGRYLRVMIAVCCIFSALFYCLLLFVPSVTKIELPIEMRPAVKFSCDENGAIIHQERCRNSIGCHRWSNEDYVGNLHLERCKYACYPFDEYRSRTKFPPAQAESVQPILEHHDVLQDEQIKDKVKEEEENLKVIPLETTSFSTITDKYVRNTRSVKPKQQNTSKREAPHVCYQDGRKQTICHVFAEVRNSLKVNASLREALNPEDTEDWCAYPIAQYFKCRIPSDIQRSMGEINQTCVVECMLEHPYDPEFVENSVLAESQCSQIIGNEQLTFWMYLSIRSLADIFPTAALTLIDAAIVIATRETSTGRGDVGRQLAFGSLGFALFGPLSGYLSTLFGPSPYYYAPLALHGLLMIMATFIALTAESMPLAPPEWWWHTRSGMLALPMSAVRRYGGEAAALFIVLILAGTLWSAMDTYLPIHLLHLNGDELTIGLALTLGALPAVIFLWKSEHLVDYCGHSNLLITAFVVYIVRFTVLSRVPDVWCSLVPESLELFTLGIMWVTAILYFRHLIPRQMTTTGQALPVIAHFCIGRSLGALIGACVDKAARNDEVESMRYIYQLLAIASAVIATLYFGLYHGLLKPRCHAQTVHQNGQRQPPSIVQAINGNGSYTPLRVYHNGMGKKGQFRY